MTNTLRSDELIQYGIVAYHKAKFEEAKKLFDQALEIDNEATEAMNYKGLLCLLTHDYEKAIFWWEKSLEVKENFDAITHLAFQYQRLENKEKAIPLLERALTLDGSRSDLAIALSVYELEDKNYTKAKALLEPYLDFEPVDEQLMMTYAHIHHQNAEYNTAIEILEKLFEKQPESCGALQQIAKIYWHLKEYIKAQTYYVKALNLLPNHLEILKEYGVLLRDHIKVDEAIEHFQKMRAGQENDAEVHYLLATCYEIKKDHKPALTHYKRAFELYPMAGCIRQKIHQMEVAIKAL